MYQPALVRGPCLVLLDGLCQGLLAGEHHLRDKGSWSLQFFCVMQREFCVLENGIISSSSQKCSFAFKGSATRLDEEAALRRTYEPLSCSP